MLATPTLATDAGELIWRALEREATGVLHCVRRRARRPRQRSPAARPPRSSSIPTLVRTGPPPEPPAGAVPYDTRLDATRDRARALGVELPDLDTQLARLRHEMEDVTCATT